MQCIQERGRDYAGVIGLSTWMPLRKYLTETPSTSDAIKRIKPKRALLCHGSIDEVVRPKYYHMTVEAMRSQLGMSDELSAEIFPGLSHASSPDELQKVASWIKEALPP